MSPLHSPSPTGQPRSAYHAEELAIHCTRDAPVRQEVKGIRRVTVATHPGERSNHELHRECKIHHRDNEDERRGVVALDGW